MSRCNYKVAAIVIAVLTIMSSVSNIFKSSHQWHGDDLECHRRHHHKHHPDHHHHHHGHHHHHKNSTEIQKLKKDFIETERDEEEEIKKPHMERSDEHKDRISEKKHGSKVRAVKIGSIVSNILCIITAALIFAVVSDNHEKNKLRRKFLLPYIIWHIVVICICVAGAIYTAIAFRENFKRDAVSLMLFWGLGVLVTSIFLYFVTKYYNLLIDAEEKPAAGDTGFTYSKMAVIDA